MSEKFDIYTKVQDVNESLGLVLGYAIVCKEGGLPYFDLQGDHIPEETMIESAAEFMRNSRLAKDMHGGDGIGEVVFAFPMTDEIAKSMDLTCKKTGLMIGMKVDDEDILAKFASGEYTGFSIGGRRIEDEEIDLTSELENA